VELPNGILPCDEPVVTLIPVISGGDTASLGLKWVDGSTASTLTISEAGPVWLEVTDICGTERSEAMVEWADISPDLSIVYVPNVMKPSAVIAENATFKPLFAAGIDLLEFKFMIFDRWGNQLFQTQSTEEAWDGVFDGQAMNPAVHVWYLEADVAICGRIIHVVKKGDVTIVR
jgi:gliding motility-associated-like protein